MSDIDIFHTKDIKGKVLKIVLCVAAVIGAIALWCVAYELALVRAGLPPL